MSTFSFWVPTFLLRVPTLHATLDVRLHGLVCVEVTWDRVSKNQTKEITNDTDNSMNQSKLEANAQENVCE